MADPTIRRIGWAGYVVTTEAGTKVVVDPYLHGSEGPHSGLPESPVTVNELARADVVAVTHVGYDHRAQAIDVTLAGAATLVCGTVIPVHYRAGDSAPDDLRNELQESISSNGRHDEPGDK